MTATTTATATTGLILALDLGKYKSIACGHDGASGTFRFTSFETTRSAIHRLLTGDRPTVVIIEACLLAGWVRGARRPGARLSHPRRNLQRAGAKQPARRRTPATWMVGAAKKTPNGA